MTYKIAAILYAVIIAAFILAKLSGLLPISWWLILIPLWLPVVLVLIVALGAVALLGDASTKGENPFQ